MRRGPRRRCSRCRRRAPPAARGASSHRRATAATRASSRAAARDRPGAPLLKSVGAVAVARVLVGDATKSAPTMAARQCRDDDQHGSSSAATSASASPALRPADAARLALARRSCRSARAFAQPLDRRGVGEPEEARRVEALARRDAPRALREERFGEIGGGAARRRRRALRDSREQVERAARLDAARSADPRSASRTPGRAGGGTRPASSSTPPAGRSARRPPPSA